MKYSEKNGEVQITKDTLGKDDKGLPQMQQTTWSMNADQMAKMMPMFENELDAKDKSAALKLAADLSIAVKHE